MIVRKWNHSNQKLRNTHNKLIKKNNNYNNDDKNNNNSKTCNWCQEQENSHDQSHDSFAFNRNKISMLWLTMYGTVYEFLFNHKYSQPPSTLIIILNPLYCKKLCIFKVTKFRSFFQTWQQFNFAIALIGIRGDLNWKLWIHQNHWKNSNLKTSQLFSNSTLYWHFFTSN